MMTLLILFSLSALSPDDRAAATITPASLRGPIRFLSDDLLEGRLPGTRGDALAQAYVASWFETLGLEAAGDDGGYRQAVPLIGVDGHPSELVFSSDAGVQRLAHGTDMMAVAGAPVTSSALRRAEVVFVGYGIQAPEFGWDDFKGVDVRGKVLLVLNNDPEHDPALFAGKTRLWYGRWDYKYEKAASLGAVGCFIVHTTPSAGYPWQVVKTSWSGEQFDLPSTGAPELEVKGWVTEEAARQIVALGGQTLDALVSLAQTRTFKPVALNARVDTAFSSRVERRASANVLGLLRGSDPALSSEVVVVTAHHDHLGQSAARDGSDGIYNGALDNASGVSALLGLARALAGMPTRPRRSVLFAAVAGEEQGLLGSQYLVAHPPVPHAKMALNLNIDGMNILGRTRDLSVIGLGKTSIDPLLERLAAQQGRTVKADALPDRGFFYRSDQFNFAKVGVPAAYFSSGIDYLGRPPGWGRAQREQWEAKNYHQPSDELREDWDLSGAVEDVQLYLRLVLAVGNAPRMPTWTPNDEFEATRLRSLKEAARRTP